MSTRYLEILSLQSPQDIGTVDAQNRAMFSNNYNVMCEGPSDKFEKEMRKLIIDAGLATYSETSPGVAAPGSNIFISSKAVLPSGAGPFVLIKNTGGLAPDEEHGGKKYERLSFQVMVYAGDYEAGRVKANAIWRELDGKRSITVTV